MKYAVGVLLLASSCVWVSEDQVRRRTDRDGDGVPATQDCNDGNGTFVGLPDPSDNPSEGTFIQTFDDAVQPQDCTLQCGRTSTCTLPDANPLEFSNCVDPGRPNRRLRYGPNVAVFELDSEGFDHMRLTLRDADPLNEPSPLFVREIENSDLREPPEVILMANRGRQCDPDACQLGFPLRGQAEAEQLDDDDNPLFVATEAILEVDQAAGVEWFVSVSGRTGAFTVEVECFDTQPADPGFGTP